MPARSHLRPLTRTLVAVAFVAWAALLVTTLLSPSAAGPSWLVETVARAADALGLPAAVSAPARVEFALNVGAFVPVSLLGTMLWTRLTWRDWTAAGFVASLGVEAVQAVALDGRSATHADVVSNTLGALMGAVLGAVVMRAGADGDSSEGRADLPHGHSTTQQDHLPR